MKKPTDDPRRPARTRRFSAIKAPVKRAGPAIEGDAAPAVETAAGEPAPGAAEAMAPAAISAPGDAAGAARVEPAPGASGKADRPAVRAERDEARVAKVMSRAGLCSRREAETWIAAGRVAVNGTLIESPALNIGPTDQITVDGYPIDKPEHTRLFMFHKTRGLVTTARDPEGRPTIYDALPEELPRLMTVGRLDINTEGLLLLTNDGGLARLLELPSTGWLRRYRVRANGRVEQSQLDALAKGVTVEGVDYAGIDARLDRIQGANLWLTLGLREGKNREVKRVLEHLGLAVTRLIRLSFGPFQLGDLPENGVEEVRTRVLRDQLGSALAKRAGLDLRTEETEVRPPAAPVDQEPRRKTSRSATADRRGRAVAVERITSVHRSAPERDTGGRTARRVPPGRPAAGPEREAPGRVGEQPGARTGQRADRGEGRPARTLRQSDAEALRREQGPRPDRAPRDARGPRPGPTAERPARFGSSASRGEAPRFKTASRDGDRPRTGRNRDEPGSRGPSRPPRSERSEDRPRPGRSGSAGKASFGSPGSARPDERARPPRSEAGAGKGAPRAGRPAGREGAGPGRPSGGKPPFRGGEGRPGKPPGGGAGGGRGRPRG